MRLDLEGVGEQRVADVAGGSLIGVQHLPEPRDLRLHPGLLPPVGELWRRQRRPFRVVREPVAGLQDLRQRHGIDGARRHADDHVRGARPRHEQSVDHTQLHHGVERAAGEGDGPNRCPGVTDAVLLASLRSGRRRRNGRWVSRRVNACCSARHGHRLTPAARDSLRDRRSTPLASVVVCRP